MSVLARECEARYALQCVGVAVLSELAAVASVRPLPS